MSDEEDEFVNNKEYLFNKNAVASMSPTSAQNKRPTQKKSKEIAPDIQSSINNAQNFRTKHS